MEHCQGAGVSGVPASGGASAKVKLLGVSEEEETRWSRTSLTFDWKWKLRRQWEPSWSELWFKLGQELKVNTHFDPAAQPPHSDFAISTARLLTVCSAASCTLFMSGWGGGGGGVLSFSMDPIFAALYEPLPLLVSLQICQSTTAEVAFVKRKNTDLNFIKVQPFPLHRYKRIKEAITLSSSFSLMLIRLKGFKRDRLFSWNHCGLVWRLL